MRIENSAAATERNERPQTNIGRTAEVSPAPTPTAQQWEEEDQLRQIETLLTLDGPNDPNQQRTYRRELARFDFGHGLPGAWHLDAATSKKKGDDLSQSSETDAPRTSREIRRSGHSTIGPWTYLALLVGTTALVCGGSLLGWSMISGRAELWNLGLPIALGGQITLLAALLIQLERLWADHRRSAERIETVNSRLHDLQHATTLLGTSATSPASQFYAHYAHGADAKVLLTDLKSQLDLLALRVSQQQDRSA